MRAFVVGVLLVVAVAAVPFLTQERVDKINAIPGLSWTASADQGSTIGGASLQSIKALLGAKTRIKRTDIPLRTFSKEERDVPVPESFDSAAHWKQCPSIAEIRDQSACGSCWAIAAVEAMSDRYCIGGMKSKPRISTLNLMSCCSFCGSGCNGGFPGMAWNYWVTSGLTDEKCHPYPFPKCAHHGNSSKYPDCPEDTYPTPACKTKCTDPAVTPVKYYGSKIYRVNDEEPYQRELMAYGPFEVAFDVHEDFLAYKSGVYQSTPGSEYLGGHAVRIVGWGVLNGDKYWKVANSWNEGWGMDGYFLIKRGVDECGIEMEGVAGTPKM